MFFHYRDATHCGWVYPAERGQKYQRFPMYYWSFCPNPDCLGELPDLSVAYGQFLRAIMDEGEEGG